MIRPSGPLQALIDAERPIIGPPADAATLCWQRIVADLERGVRPDVEAPPPPTSSHHGTMWLALMLIGAGIITAGLHGWSGDPAASVVAPPVVAAFAAAPEARPAPPLPAIVAPPPAPVLRGAPEATVAEAVDPRPSPHRPQASLPVLEDTFAAELQLLAEGHATLNRGDAAGALRVFTTYKVSYPRGHFKEDSEALQALALCAAGEGTAAARRFLRTRLRSIHVTRIREACGLPENAHE